MNNHLNNIFDNIVVLSKWSFCVIGVGIEEGKAAAQLAIDPAKQIIINSIENNMDFTKNDKQFDQMFANFSEKVYKVKNDSNTGKEVVTESRTQQIADKMKKICDEIKHMILYCYSKLIADKIPFEVAYES